MLKISGWTTESDFLLSLSPNASVHWDDKIFVTYRGDDVVDVLSDSALYAEVQFFQIPGMKFPIDTVASTDDQCIYIADFGSECAELRSPDGCRLPDCIDRGGYR